MLRVLSLTSLFPQFAGQQRISMLSENTPCGFSGKREKKPGRVLVEKIFFQLSSLFSQFAILCGRAGYAAHGGAGILESQPTRCGHTLRGVHCRGLASGLRPLRTLQRQKP